MTDIDIPELRRLAEAGTPGPWVVHARAYSTAALTIGRAEPGAGYTVANVPQQYSVSRPQDRAVIALANAAKIVAAVNHLTPLLDRLEAAESTLKTIRDGKTGYGLGPDAQSLAIRHFERFAP